MQIQMIATILILAAVLLLALSTIPVSNKIENGTLTVKFILGQKIIDMKDARFLPVPEETEHNIIRIGGTSIGKKRSGNFYNYKTKTWYQFYLIGKGAKTYFEIGDKKYLVDGLE